MNIVITAKKLNWTERGSNLNKGDRGWDDKNNLGFYIEEDTTEPPEDRFQASWGESDTEYCSTLKEAKDWCQSEINWFIRLHGKIDTE